MVCDQVLDYERKLERMVEELRNNKQDRQDLQDKVTVTCRTRKVVVTGQGSGHGQDMWDEAVVACSPDQFPECWKSLVLTHAGTPLP